MQIGIVRAFLKPSQDDENWGALGISRRRCVLPCLSGAW